MTRENLKGVRRGVEARFRLSRGRGRATLAPLRREYAVKWGAGKEFVSRRFSPRSKWQLFDESFSSVPEKQFTLVLKAAVGRLLERV